MLIIFFSPYLCRYRKVFNTQQGLISSIRKWKNILNKKGCVNDLSKAFDTLNHNLLITKLHASVLQESHSTWLKVTWQINRCQRTKVNTIFTSGSELLIRVSQGSVLGPLLFNIYVNGLFSEITEIANVCN